MKTKNSAVSFWRMIAVACLFGALCWYGIVKAATYAIVKLMN